MYLLRVYRAPAVCPHVAEHYSHLAPTAELGLLLDSAARNAETLRTNRWDVQSHHMTYVYARASAYFIVAMVFFQPQDQWADDRIKGVLTALLNVSSMTNLSRTITITMTAQKQPTDTVLDLRHVGIVSEDFEPMSVPTRPFWHWLTAIGVLYCSAAIRVAIL